MASDYSSHLLSVYCVPGIVLRAGLNNVYPPGARSLVMTVIYFILINNSTITICDLRTKNLGLRNVDWLTKKRVKGE